MQLDTRRGRSGQPWRTKVGAQRIGRVDLVGLIRERRALARLKAHQRDAVAAQLGESEQQFGAQRFGHGLVWRNNNLITGKLHVWLKMPTTNPGVIPDEAWWQ
jgi:hypothetical protein